MEFHFSEVEIVKCLNDIVDKVCKDFEKYSELLNDNLSMYENDVTEDDSPMPFNEITKSITTTYNTQSKKNTPKIKIKSNKLKKAKPSRKKNNKLDIENVNRMSPIKERESAAKHLILKEKNSNQTEKKSDDAKYETPLIRRKRKLYSPKDDTEINEEVGIHISDTEEDTVPSASKVYDKTPKSLATSYKEINIIRKDTVRRLRNKRLLRESVSPRTKKMNDIFDNLKKNEDGQEKIMLADGVTRNEKLAVYNFSSDSEESEDFKLKKPVGKSSITTLGKTKSIQHRGTRRSKRLNKVNINETKLNGTENVNKNDTKPKTVRVRANTKKTDLKSRPNLEDERLRDTVVEVLNCSLVIEEPPDNLTEVEPVIKEPEMETIIDEVKKNKKIIKKDLSLKKKNIDNKIEKDSDQDSVSSLPVLIVEKAQVHREADDSVKSVLLDNLKDISEFNTTQNLLDDLETNNRSPPKLNITDEFNKISNKSNPQTDTPNQNKSANNKSKSKRNKTRKLSNDSEDINKNKFKTKTKVTKVRKLSIVSDESDKIEIIKDKSDISIATVGRSPITARGHLEGSPPNTEQLNEPVIPRNLEIEDLNQSTQDYFEKLTLQLNASLCSSSTNEINTKTNNDSLEKLKTLPSVLITRLSPQEIRKWQPTRMNSIFGSSVTSDVSFRTTRNQSKNSSNKIGSNPTTSMQIRKSLISPIKMLGETDKVKSNSSQSDGYVNHIKGMMTRKNSKPSSPKSLESSKYNESITEDDKSSISKENTKISSKRKALSPILSVGKIKKVNSKSSIGNVTKTASVNSSSVQEWLKRDDRENPVESLDHSLRDHLEQIMEKLDTTLVEIHHATSKKFVNMFVDAHKHLDELKADRRRLYGETATRAVADIVETMERKFSDLDKRSQELDEQFIENLKQKAKELIRKDCKQKRTMVMLLQEDINTVLKQTGNKND